MGRKKENEQRKIRRMVDSYRKVRKPMPPPSRAIQSPRRKRLDEIAEEEAEQEVRNFTRR